MSTGKLPTGPQPDKLDLTIYVKNLISGKSKQDLTRNDHRILELIEAGGKILTDRTLYRGGI